MLGQKRASSEYEKNLKSMEEEMKKIKPTEYEILNASRFDAARENAEKLDSWSHYR